MRVPLDESMDEHDFDDEFAALPPTTDPAADLHRGRRHAHTRRRRTATLGTLAAALVAGIALWRSPGPLTAVPAGPPPASSSPAVSTTPPNPAPGSCIGTIRLVPSAGEPVVLTRTSSPTIQLRVGEIIRLQADGRCGRIATFSYETDLLNLDSYTVQAVRPGSTRLSVGHGVCAELAPHPGGCAGPDVPDGDVNVIIRP